MRIRTAIAFVVAYEVISGSKVMAGGVEYAGAGTQALGRGAAVAARADDPMVLVYNPAGLVELRGSQLLFNANVALMSACVDPLGYYGWGSAYPGGKPARLTAQRTGSSLTLQLGRASSLGPAEQSYYDSAYDTVCLDQAVTPVPQLGVTARVTERFGIGLGMMFPSVTPQGTWGSQNGVIEGAGGLRPAATRYMMTQSGSVGIFPTLGAAYKLADWLRVGAAFRWGMINVDNTSVAASQVGTTPGNDLLVRVRATDWYIPELTASVHIVPFDALDVVGGFHYQGDLDAPGTISVTTGEYDAMGVARTTDAQVGAVKQKFPWSAWGALRYASRLSPRPRGPGKDDLDVAKGDGLHDAFQEERFDVEIDIQYEMNARHRDLTVDYVPNQKVAFESTAGTTTMQLFPDPTLPATVIQKRWKDQISARLGGSYNILPGLFGVSAGIHYETRGVDPSYMQIDYWPLKRLGLHAGVRVRIGRAIDLMFSYAHIFQETLVVSAPPHGNFDAIGTNYIETNQVTAIDKRTGLASAANPMPAPREEQRPATSDGEARLTQNYSKVLRGTPPVIINSGTYRSGIDVLSAGMTVHF